MKRSARIALVSAMFVANCGGPSPAPQQTDRTLTHGEHELRDDFNDNNIDAAKWSVGHDMYYDPLVTVVEANSRMELTTRNLIAGERANALRSVQTFDFTGASLVVEFPDPPPATAFGAYGSLVLAIDAKNYFAVNQDFIDIFAVMGVNGVRTNDGGRLFYATPHRWWRIRHVESDDTIRWDVSPDGAVWSELWSRPRPFPVTRLRVELNAGSYHSIASKVIVFDNLSLRRGSETKTSEQPPSTPEMPTTPPNTIGPAGTPPPAPRTSAPTTTTAPVAPTAPKPSARPAYTRTDLQVGTGREAQKGKGLSVHYTGWLYDPTQPGMKGRMFDSSKQRGQFDFVLGAGQVIPGWDQGFDGMKIGGRRRLIIPPALAYGVDGAGGGIIPPDATLIFEMELLDVQQ
jgi:FKBP-type peptidyl-prolyl cis-trans isomerase FkpA